MTGQTVLKPMLLRWQLRQLLPVNLPAIVVAGLVTLFRSEPMIAPGSVTMLVAIVIHCGLLVWRLSSMAPGNNSFVHVQGYTRDQIWWQVLLASLISGAMVCGTVWLLMVSRLRCVIQDGWMSNPWFPVTATREYSLPWVLLFGYIVVLPMMHYVWIRARNPYQESASGWLLLILGLSFQLWGCYRIYPHRLETGFLLSLMALHVPATLLLTVACWRLHRTLEVRR